MAATYPGEITRLLLDWQNGNQDAFSRLITLVYKELHSIAKRQLKARGLGNLLQPTTLVHEAYIKLVDEKQVSWQNRAHFFAIVAKTIHRILVDNYRKRIADKRGGREVVHISLTAVDDNSPINQEHTQIVDLMAINESLEKLKVLDERRAEIAELKLFGGMRNNEIGTVLNISEDVAGREWRVARAWIYDRLFKK